MTQSSCWSGGQIQGKRNYQEDVFKIVPPSAKTRQLVCALADGMGGHAAGDVAAKLVAGAFCKEISENQTPPHENFLTALDVANRAITSHIKKHPDVEGMGTTLIGIELAGDKLHWISVGDSILYHVSGTKVEQINANHSMAPQLDAAAKRGEISTEDALNSSSRNVLLSALTGDPIGRVDISRKPLQLAPDDLVIIASDGIETLSPEQVGMLVAQNEGANPDQLCKALLSAVENANKEGQDNTTIMVLRPFMVTSVEDAPQSGATADADEDEIITRVVEPR